MSVPLGSVHTISVSSAHQRRFLVRGVCVSYLAASGSCHLCRSSSPAASAPAGPPTQHIFAIPPVRFRQLRRHAYTATARRAVENVVWDRSWMLLERGLSYIDDLAGTKACAPVEPVIVPELIDLHPLLVVGRRHRQCHSRSSQLAPSALRQGLDKPLRRVTR